jgi:DHA1 family multidrug resistance protein-like MFS transporter
MFSASAITATTILRSFVASTFPLFTAQMFQKLVVNCAGSLLGFIALALVPVPVLFYIFKSKLRQKSRVAPTRNI